ncbi:MAG TPA: SDR family oxidoreductase [Acidimicrobiales bacterium]|nr:SDR family oxidoreductase [Acidimicrobiales bacterium]
MVLVTGGSRGIGAAIASRFAAEGATVIAADLDPGHPDGRICDEQVDVASAESVQALFDRVHADHGGVDVLVNNAGIWFRRTFAEISVEEWDRVLGVNLRGVFLCSQAALGPMIAAGGGVILNVGSQAGLTITRGQGAHYAASKAAVAHLTQVMAFELGAHGIRVNCVAPATAPPDPSMVPPDLLRQIPLGRAATPDDFTGACVFLASPEAAYITGQTIPVNGGAVGFV